MEGEKTKVKVKVKDRMRAMGPTVSPTTRRMVDMYLSNNLPDLIERHDLALKSDLAEVYDLSGSIEGRVEILEDWKEKTTPRIDDCRRRMENLEKKYGVKE